MMLPAGTRARRRQLASLCFILLGVVAATWHSFADEPTSFDFGLPTAGTILFVLTYLVNRRTKDATAPVTGSVRSAAADWSLARLGAFASCYVVVVFGAGTLVSHRSPGWLASEWPYLAGLLVAIPFSIPWRAMRWRMWGVPKPPPGVL